MSREHLRAGPIRSHFELRFFETYGLFHEWSGTGFYWRADGTRCSFALPPRSANEWALAEIERKCEHDVELAVERIDRLFAYYPLARLGLTLPMVASYWHEARSLYALSARFADLEAQTKRAGVA